MRILQWPGGRGREEGGEEGEPAVFTLALSPGRLPKGQRGQQDKELSSFASRFRLGGWPGRSPTQRCRPLGKARAVPAGTVLTADSSVSDRERRRREVVLPKRFRKRYGTNPQTA